MLVTVLAIYPFIDQSENPQKLTGLPWQIEVLQDGSTRVFEMDIGKSRLSEARDVLGSDMQLAIIAATDEIGNLEMYYGHYRAGLLSGKLVLHTNTREENIQNWRENAIKSEPMASGQARKYLLSENDSNLALNEVVTGLTFIPAVNLDDDVIVARFGTPQERIQLEGVAYYRYPKMGLDIALYEDAKEVLQYVSPNDYQHHWVAE